MQDGCDVRSGEDCAEFECELLGVGAGRELVSGVCLARRAARWIRRRGPRASRARPRARAPGRVTGLRVLGCAARRLASGAARASRGPGRPSSLTVYTYDRTVL